MNILQIYDYHSIYIYIFINYDILQIRDDFFITILYILSPLIQYCTKSYHLKKIRDGARLVRPPLNQPLSCKDTQHRNNVFQFLVVFFFNSIDVWFLIPKTHLLKWILVHQFSLCSRVWNIPRNLEKVSFVEVQYNLTLPYPSGILQWDLGEIRLYHYSAREASIKTIGK